ncbi:multiple sugar transport system permease protein [Nocardiopsis arvandica]|uniref:Multiple sugar transport system permease protein n=1 Tax=Nocardiopsis sinuspersici TaxID=501010 RepID=A0A7Y9XCG0_9ACTN|nr:sugar ABC transporter permease [Nocardiopsis sinuspersici]NYH53054.1 multiple sugar transport system permease protein [Nocardiopsis sinuspersici]
MTATTRSAPGEESPDGPRTATAAPPRRRSRARPRALVPWGFVGPFLALFTLCFVLPILYAVYQSFIQIRRYGLFGEEGRETVFAGLDNYTRALGQETFVDSIGRVLLFGVVQVPVMLGLALVLALLLESASARWPGFFRALYFMPYGVPGVVASLLWGFLYVPGLSPILDVAGLVGLEPDLLGPSGVLWSIANIITWMFIGYNMLILVAQLKTIPGELYESARIDGAGPLQTAWNIQLPLIRPALVLTTIFSIIGTLQLFAEPQILAAFTVNIDSAYTPNMAAYNSAFTDNDYNVAAAQSVVVALTAFVLSFGFLWLVNRKDRRR